MKNSAYLIFSICALVGCGDASKNEISALRENNSKLLEQNSKINARLELAEKTAREQSGLHEKKLAALEAKIRELQTKRSGELNGVVTYFFNDNYGYKPDAGADVHIFPAEAYSGFDSAALMKFQVARLILATIAITSSQELQMEQKRRLKDLGIKNDQDWKAFDDEIRRMVSIAENGEQTLHMNADGNGSFRKKLSPGKYHVLIRSKHRESYSSQNEILGQIFSQSIDIPDGEEVSVSAKFGAY